jgi:hypothetical protein
MAKVKLQAGAEIDFLNKKEMHEELNAMMTSWVGEVSRGDRYPRFKMYGTIAGGQVSIGTEDAQLVGPDEGFCWSLRRLAIVGGSYAPATDSLGLYLGTDLNPSSVIQPPSLAKYNAYEAGEMVLMPGDQIVVAGGVAGAGKMWVTGQVRELPIPLLYRMLS